MSKSSETSRADLLIAGDFLFSCRNVRAALRSMARYGQFSDRKPARYWYSLLRHLWRDNLRNVRSYDEGLEEANAEQSIPNRSDSCVALVRELVQPLNPIINFLLLTLHLSFVCKVIASNERRGLQHVQKMPTLRSAERLQILSC
jgi:hypothetical protein